MRQRIFFVGYLALILLMAIARPASAGRYEEFTAWAAKGPKMTLKAATFFGSSSPEGFVDAAQFGDNSIVAFGNAYGPDFPATPAPLIIGSGKHTGSDPFGPDKDGHKTLKTYTPDMSGFVVFYQPDLQKIDKIIKFDWGVATIKTGAVSSDEIALILAGYCSPQKLAQAAKSAKAHKTYKNPVEFQKENERKTPAYVMRMGIGAQTIKWCWILEDFSDAPKKIWQDNVGNVYFDVDGLYKISADGETLTKIFSTNPEEKHAGIVGVDPKDGSFFVGGDRNTKVKITTPWRQPFLYKYDPQGTDKLWRIWEWSPVDEPGARGYVGSLLADSSIKMVRVAEDRDLVIAGWSDGGNTVFTQQPTDITKKAAPPSGPFNIWGCRGATSFSFIFRIDPVFFDQRIWFFWMAYLPKQGTPNSTSIDQLELLDNDCYAISGFSATGLIQTPNSFYKLPEGGGYGGRYVAVISREVANLLFSSYLPAYLNSAIAKTRGGAVIAGTAMENDLRQPSPTVPPLMNAAQEKFGGGEFDGHIMLLEWPTERK